MPLSLNPKGLSVESQYPIYMYLHLITISGFYGCAKESNDQRKLHRKLSEVNFLTTL